MHVKQKIMGIISWPFIFLVTPLISLIISTVRIVHTATADRLVAFIQSFCSTRDRVAFSCDSQSVGTCQQGCQLTWHVHRSSATSLPICFFRLFHCPFVQAPSVLEIWIAKCVRSLGQYNQHGVTDHRLISASLTITHSADWPRTYSALVEYVKLLTGLKHTCPA